MDGISELPDKLLVKILLLVPTKVAVSTSILSKRWESLWKLVPKLEGDCSKPGFRDFVIKNLPLLAPVIESLCLEYCPEEFFQLMDIRLWVGIAVSCCLRELSINTTSNDYGKREPYIVFPSSFCNCKSLVTLKLDGINFLVDVPRMACLPSLKTLELRYVTYSNDNSLELLLSCCPILEDLVIELAEAFDLVIIVPSLQRLSLMIVFTFTHQLIKIATPSLKYFKVNDEGGCFSYSIEHMPELEEADIHIAWIKKKLLMSVTSVKRFTLCVNSPLCRNVGEEDGFVFLEVDGIVFNQLEQLKLNIYHEYWSVLLVWLLNNSFKLRVLNLYAESKYQDYNEECCPVEYGKNLQSSDPECLKSSLETFELGGYTGKREERDFLIFIFQRACCLKSSSISRD